MNTKNILFLQITEMPRGRKPAAKKSSPKKWSPKKLSPRYHDSYTATELRAMPVKRLRTMYEAKFGVSETKLLKPALVEKLAYHVVRSPRAGSPRGSPKNVSTHTRTELRRMTRPQLKAIHVRHIGPVADSMTKIQILEAIAGKTKHRKAKTSPKKSSPKKSPGKAKSSPKKRNIHVPKSAYGKRVLCDVGAGGSISNCRATASNKDVSNQKPEHRLSSAKSVPKRFHGKTIRCSAGKTGGLHSCKETKATRGK
jgi:hypothetical protein